jgi:hypothetical protein
MMKMTSTNKSRWRTMALALGGGYTHIYLSDEDGVGQVKKEDEGVNLGGGRARVDVSESCLARHA